MKKSLIRIDGTTAGLLVGAVLVAMSLVACPPKPVEPTDGTCCRFTGPVNYDCASIENLGPGADLDGRCNAVNQGQSCSWDYSIEECCERAVNDGFGNVTCGPDTTGTSGSCCRFTGPVAFDCASIENLPPGGDLDGRCNAVNQGQSCSWFYGNDDCCKIAVDDGIPGSVSCN